MPNRVVRRSAAMSSTARREMMTTMEMQMVEGLIPRDCLRVLKKGWSWRSSSMLANMVVRRDLVSLRLIVAISGTRNDKEG